MENLTTALEGKKLEDLKTTLTVAKSNLLEPTKEEVEQIITLLKEGKRYKEIRTTVRRITEKDGKQTSAKGFSYGQIKEIDLAREKKIVELTPCPECGKAPCVCPKPEPIVEPILETK